MSAPPGTREPTVAERGVCDFLGIKLDAVTYDEVFDSFKTIVADLTPAEQRRLFHDNAVRLYRVPVSPGAAA